MLISIVVPVYNVQDFLSQCIDSLINQDYKNIEIILVNDGSTDNSGKICDSYERKYSNIKVIHKPNGGLSSARNAGVRIAKGDYVTFIDSDDFWIEGKLNQMVKMLKEKDLDMLLFKAFSYYESTKSYEPFSKEYDSTCFNGTGQQVLSNILESDYDFGWCAVFYLIKREVIIENNLFFLEGYLAEDVNYIFRLWNLAKSVGYYDDYVYAYRRENQNSITHVASFKFCNNLLEVMEINLDLYKTFKVSGKLKNLVYLNMQTLVNVILFWFYKYSKDEKKILYNKIKNINYIYNIDDEYKDLIGKKEKIVANILKFGGVYFTGFLWSIKSKIIKEKIR